MAIIAKFTRTLPAPSATISGGFVFLLYAGWFTQANTGAAGSPIDGGTNSLANGGGDMKIFSDTAATTQLPIEVVSFVTGGSPSAQVWVRTPSYTAGDTITIGKDDAQTAQPVVGAVFGRNATWVDYEYNFHLDSSNKLIDSTGNHSLTESGFVSSITGQIEGGVTSSGSAVNKLSLSAYTGPSGSTARTHKLWGKTAAVSDRSILEYGTDATGKRYTIRFDDTSVAGSFRTEIQGSFAYTNNSFNDGLWHCFVSKVDGTTSFPACYSAVVDGVNQALTTGTSQSINTVPLGNVGFDANIKSFFIPSDQDEQSLRLFHTTDAQDASECLNESDPDNFGTSSEYILVGGGGSTLTADSGAYLYTGTDAQLLTTRILKADTGAYLHTGTSVSLLKGFILTAQSGSYSYSGQDATLTYTPAGAFILTADSGNYTYTGSNINFNRDRVIIASSGTYNYSGTDIQIILPGQIWTDKPSASTNWNNQTVTTTIWTDK